MKYFLDRLSKRTCLLLVGVAAVGVVATLSMGELPSWIRNVEANSAMEAVFFRMMSLPSAAVAFRRPPAETRPALTELIKAQPHNADLYSLRALEDERQLDFTAAEADWKAYVENSSDKVNAQLALADFYHHRVRPADEIKIVGRRSSEFSAWFRAKDFRKMSQSRSTEHGLRAIPRMNRSTVVFLSSWLRRRNMQLRRN